MALRKFNPTTPSQRQLVLIDRSELWKGRPEKTLTSGLSSAGGRNNLGRITTYVLLGLLFGLLGRSLALAGLQRMVPDLRAASVAELAAFVDTLPQGGAA